MSLQHAAQHLAAHGRGPDTTLVHMSKGEVKSLNDLAMAHGGHLTINPHTGLPEAGFLSSLLPMIAGAGLTAVSGGAINPLTASLLVGGVTGVMTGSLSKGLMAGLGAYGGAGLGSSLASSGMQAEAAAAEAAKTGPFAANVTPAAVPAAPTPMVDYSSIGAVDVTSPVSAQYGSVSDALVKAPAAPLGAPMTSAGVPVADLSASQNLGYMGKGLSTLGSQAGWSQLASNAGGGMDLAKYGLAAAAPTISEAMAPKPVQKPAEDKDLGQRYEYSPGAVTPTPKADPYGREQRYFNPTYTPISADRAKSIYGYAGGGPVEAMSNANAIGTNTGYPMADINKGEYATPWQTPISRNVIADTSDTGVNPLTGEMTNFADGGVATATPMPGGEPSYEYDPMKQLFAKIESMPSDDQNKQAAEAQRMGGGLQTPMTDAQFAAQQEAGQKNLQSMGEFGSKLSEGLSNFKQALINGDIGLIGPLAKAVYGQMSTSSGGVSPSSGSPMGGISSTGTHAQAAAANAAANAAAASGGRGGSGNVGTGGGSTASGQGTGIGGLGGMGGGLAGGGLSHLGDYSDGGRLLRGPGDGVSDSIPAVIGKKQPARLADGEFVVPARIVSELGNGSTEAGARKLYAMMDRIQKARGSTVGKGKVAKNSRAEKYLPA